MCWYILVFLTSALYSSLSCIVISMCSRDIPLGSRSLFTVNPSHLYLSVLKLKVEKMVGIRLKNLHCSIYLHHVCVDAHIHFLFW